MRCICPSCCRKCSCCSCIWIYRPIWFNTFDLAWPLCFCCITFCWGICLSWLFNRCYRCIALHSSLVPWSSPIRISYLWFWCVDIQRRRLILRWLKFRVFWNWSPVICWWTRCRFFVLLGLVWFRLLCCLSRFFLFIGWCWLICCWRTNSCLCSSSCCCSRLVFFFLSFSFFFGFLSFIFDSFLFLSLLCLSFCLFFSLFFLLLFFKFSFLSFIFFLLRFLLCLCFFSSFCLLRCLGLFCCLCLFSCFCFFSLRLFSSLFLIITYWNNICNSLCCSISTFYCICNSGCCCIHMSRNNRSINILVLNNLGWWDRFWP